MAIVSTTPKPGDQPKFYDIPDADLQKYEALDIRDIGEDEPLPAEAEKAGQIEAPGAAMKEDEVQAYRHRRIRRCIVYNRRTGYIYYWYWCYA